MDAVITYVNCADIEWQQSYAEYVLTPISPERYRDIGTLPLLINMINKYMSWINNIFIVVSSKSQINNSITSNKVKWITHDMIMPTKYIPCFNSCTIEMFLNKIPGLDEEFIYFNDDMFPISDRCNPSDFFINGKPVLKPERVHILNPKNIYRNNCKNCCKLLYDKYNIGSINPYLIHEHVCRPVLKSTMDKIWDDCSVEILNSLTRIRNSRNYNIYLFNDYDYLTGNCVKKHKNYVYTTIKDISNIKDDLHIYDYICVNDTGKCHEEHIPQALNILNSLL